MKESCMRKVNLGVCIASIRIMSERIPLYGIGDKVKIVNYGHLVWITKEAQKMYFEAGYSKNEIPQNLIFEEEGMYYYDLSPDLIGKIDIIREITVTQGVPKYSLDKNGSWYSEKQLELINKNPNN